MIFSAFLLKDQPELFALIFFQISLDIDVSFSLQNPSINHPLRFASVVQTVARSLTVFGVDCWELCKWDTSVTYDTITGIH